MSFIGRFFIFLMPDLLLKNTRWESRWREQEKTDFLTTSRIAYVLAGLVYILHYYTVDRFEGLAPSDLWFNFRFGMASISLLGLILNSFPMINNSFLLKVPMLLTGIIFTYFQSLAIIWYPKIPYLYVYFFIIASVLCLRTSLIKSILVSCLQLYLVYDNLILSKQTTPSTIFSGFVVAVVLLALLKSKQSSEINFFIANQKNFETQKKLIEAHIEFSDQIKAFLPSEISKRLSHFIQDKRMSVMQAVDEALRPKKVRIACLFTDIRGFTKSVSDLDGFVSEALLPSVKLSTQATERFKGIPRKIGDLIFAYFDSPDHRQNVLHAVKSAVEISNINKELNENLPKHLRLRRFILLSSGEAIVGNISGYESAIEITAIGKPVNFLARLDEVTKVPKIRELLLDGDILVNKEMALELQKDIPGLDLECLSLSNLNVKVRDFEDTEEVYILPISRKNFNIIFQAELKDMQKKYEGAA
jgi:class 3 adenylate cyclase